MKVFISYSQTEARLAKKITVALAHAGLDVWNPELEILPGDNWAKKVAEGLEQADAMVVLLTPESLGSGHVNSDISYAIGDKSFRGRLIPVLVGSPEQLPVNSVPWILRRLRIIRLPEQGSEDEVIRQITEALKEKEVA